MSNRPDEWRDNCDSYYCPHCGFETDNPNRLKNSGKYCPKCGKQLRWNIDEPETEEKEYTPTPERLDASFLIQFVRQNSIFDADLLEKIIDEWKQFKKIGCCGECKHWEEQIAYCELNSYFVDHEGLCCSPAESPNWTMWEKTEYCSRFERREDDE